jgi:predicted dehydrogenase
MIRFGLVGCGRISLRHSQLLGENKIKGAKLQSVCDIKIERAIKIASKYGIKYYDNIDAMLQNEEIDIVVILTESGNHAQNTFQVLKYKKHIIVEKPIALKIDDAVKMIKSSKEQGVKLFVVKQNRFNLPVKKLKEALDKKKFGKLILGTVRVRWCRDQSYYRQDSWRGTWKMDGGVLTNQASHHIDLLQWMMGEVLSVQAMSSTRLAKIESEDTAIVNLRFKNGALGIIEATTATRPKDLEGSISILGEKGSVVIEGFAVNKIKTWNFYDEISGEKMEKFSENPPNVYGFGHKEFYNNVISSLINKQDQLIDGEEGIKSLKLINAIYKSIETKQEVFMDSNPIFKKLGL